MRIKKENIVLVLSRVQINRLKTTITNLRDLCMVFTGFECACRVGEMSKFAISRINWEEGLIEKYDVKKRASRWVGVTPWLLQQLQFYISSYKPGEILFPYSTKTFDLVLKKWCAQAGIEGWVSWHLLRRSYVNQAAQIGLDVIEVQHTTGDSLSSLMKYYRRPSPGDTGRRMALFYEDDEAMRPAGFNYPNNTGFKMPAIYQPGKDVGKHWRTKVKLKPDEKS